MKIATGLLAVLLSAAASAQPDVATPAGWRDLTIATLPELAGQCMDAAAGDADGDGDLDLALAMEFEPNLLLVNDGRGRFTTGIDRLPRTTHDSEDITFADFDGDGEPDLVLVSEDDRIDELYLHDGDGYFRDASIRMPASAVSNALAVLDLDRDGRPDVLIGNVGTNRVLRNDGGRAFVDATAEHWPQSGESRTQDIELADVDGDGDFDVIVGNEGQNELYLNDDGRLVDATATQLPARSDETREIRAEDVDGDGDLDLVVANVDFLMGVSARDYLLLNDGSGVFVEAEAARYPEDARNNFTVQLVDLDDDGDLDAILPSTVFAADGAGDYFVLLNDGAGRFARAATGEVLPESATGNGFDIEVADFDGDGAVELFLCNRASSPDEPARSGGLQRLIGR